MVSAQQKAEAGGGRRKEEQIMGEGTDRISSFTRRWWILEYLRRNSDPEHLASRDLMRGMDDLKKYAESKAAFNDSVRDLAMALNHDENGAILPQKDWKVFYRAFCEKYGGREDGEDDTPADNVSAEGRKKEPRMPIRGLYYRHTFSYEEINALIEGILFSRTLDSQTANLLIEKIENQLTTKFYKKGPKNICTVREPMLGDRERLRENLLLIQRAIDDEVKIAFRFNGYDRRRELVPVRNKKDVVSPYYLIASGGRYYMLACAEGREDASIWRVDLLTELKIPGRSKRRKGERALEKRKVMGLPQVWDEKFHFRHLNMAYDQPVEITLRINNPREWSDGEMRQNYTFLYDWFGDTFHYERTETEPPYGDIVTLLCSPFAMVNWALQYSDVVEVLEPESVREAVAEKIRRLERKYGIGEDPGRKAED